MKALSAMTRHVAAAVLAVGLVPAALAQAPTGELLKRTMCVFDPIGQNGPLFAVTKSFRPAILKEGIEMDMRAYTDEKIAAEDFKAKQCDAALISGTRAREFNGFTGTLEALGAIPSDEAMRILFHTLAQPKAAEYLINGNIEVAGVFPAGAVYLMTRDRTIDSLEKLQGRKVATLDYDEASLTMVRHVGASVVGSNAANFAGKFNNGSVDLAYAPAVAFTPMELYKGLQNNGGVMRFPLAYMNFQVLLHRDRFPEGSGDKVRQQALERIEEVYKIIADAEAEIKPEYWMDPAPEQIEAYRVMMRDVRIQLRDRGVYDARALRLMKAVRCRLEPAQAECSQALE